MHTILELMQNLAGQGQQIIPPLQKKKKKGWEVQCTSKEGQCFDILCLGGIWLVSSK